MKKLSLTQATAIRRALVRKEETIAVAESVTGGLLQYALSTIPEASTFYQGGLTAFNLAQKYKHLQVEPIHAEEVNCVSSKVAGQMAVSVCSMFASDWGIAVTGYATAVPESGEKLYAWFAISHKDKIRKEGKLIPANTDPNKVQEEYVERVIQQFIRMVSTSSK